jgi:hypothetical protein
MAAALRSASSVSSARNSGRKHDSNHAGLVLSRKSRCAPRITDLTTCLDCVRAGPAMIVCWLLAVRALVVTASRSHAETSRANVRAAAKKRCRTTERSYASTFGPGPRLHRHDRSQTEAAAHRAKQHSGERSSVARETAERRRPMGSPSGDASSGDLGAVLVGGSRKISPL